MGKDSRSNMERYCESRASVVECGFPSAAFGLQDGVTGACTWRYRRIEKRQKRQAHSTTLARGSVALGASAPLRVFHRNNEYSLVLSIEYTLGTKKDLTNARLSLILTRS